MIPMILFKCVSCNKAYSVPLKLAGKKAKCGKCGAINRVPIENETVAGRLSPPAETTENRTPPSHLERKASRYLWPAIAIGAFLLSAVLLLGAFLLISGKSIEGGVAGKMAVDRGNRPPKAPSFMEEYRARKRGRQKDALDAVNQENLDTLMSGYYQMRSLARRMGLYDCKPEKKEIYTYSPKTDEERLFLGQVMTDIDALHISAEYVRALQSQNISEAIEPGVEYVKALETCWTELKLFREHQNANK